MLKGAIEFESDTLFTHYNIDSPIDCEKLRACIEKKVTNDVCSSIAMSLGKSRAPVRSRRPFSCCTV